MVDVGGGTSDFSLIAVLERDGNPSCTAWRWASTSCSAATTWTWRWPTRWPASSPPRAPGSTPGRCGADPRLPLGQGGAARRRGARRGAAGHRRTRAKLIGGSLRSELTRKGARRDPARRLFPAAAIGDRPQGAGAAAHPARPALRPGCGGEPSPGGFPVPPAGGHRRARGLSANLPTGPASCTHRGALQRWRVQSPELLARRTLGDHQRLARRRRAPGRADLAVPTSTSQWPTAPPTTPMRTPWPGVHPRRHGTRLQYAAIRIGDACDSGFRATRAGAVPGAFGMEEGTEAAVSARDFGLVVGEQVSLRFFSSSVRRQDQVGTCSRSGNPMNSRSSTSSRPPCRPSGTRRRGNPGGTAGASDRGRDARTRSGRTRRQRALEGGVRHAGAGRRQRRMSLRYHVGIDLGHQQHCACLRRARRIRSSSCCRSTSCWHRASWSAAAAASVRHHPAPGEIDPAGLQLPWPAGQQPAIRPRRCSAGWRWTWRAGAGRLVTSIRAGCRNDGSTASRRSCPGAATTASPDLAGGGQRQLSPMCAQPGCGVSRMRRSGTSRSC